MHVFITGGTGLIGSAVVAELIDNGHTVLALARSDASAQAVEAAGAQPWRGNLADHAALRAGAAQADAVIHLAFGNDYSTADALAQSVAQDTAAIETLGDELVGSDRPFVLVSGTPWVAGRLSTEEDPVPTEGPVGGRGRAVNAALALASQGVRSSAVRMPRTVHNQGKGGFAGLLTDTARRAGVSGYPGDGTQRWPAVHAIDAAVLFRLALEQAPAGTSWHAVADEGDAVRDIATVIGRRLGLPVESVPEDTFGPFGPIFAADQPASSMHTRAALGWEPPVVLPHPWRASALRGEPVRCCAAAAAVRCRSRTRRRQAPRISRLCLCLASTSASSRAIGTVRAEPSVLVGRRLPCRSTCAPNSISASSTSSMRTAFVDGARGTLVRHADDCVVICRSEAQARAARQLAGEILAGLGPELHREKTKVVDLRDGRDGFDFLGCHFRARVSGRMLERGVRRYYLQRWPAQRAMNRVRGKTRPRPVVGGRVRISAR